MPNNAEKLRILVDKVMQPEEGWVTKEWMIEETADAGFNLYSPRKGHDQYDQIGLVAEWCEAREMMAMPWMAGTLTAPKGEEAEGRRLVWESGLEQDLWSPNSDRFWSWMKGHIVQHAKISAEMPNLIGVFLDFENYAAGKPRHQGNCYSLSYDDAILERFSGAIDREIPDLPAHRRGEWLESNGLHEDFADFQIGFWSDRCRELRSSVDEHNPEFRFCIYPAPGTMFMTEACYEEWSTERAPLILADAATYGRPSRFMTQERAIEANRKKLRERRKIPTDAKIPFTYISGIDPVVIGADPEFCGKNAIGIADASDGYWVFYEGPKYHGEHPDYFRWFRVANTAIVNGELEAWRGPRETFSRWGLALSDDGTKRPRVLAPDREPEMRTYPAATMTGGNTILVGARAGLQVQLGIEAEGSHQHPIRWILRDPAYEMLDRGEMGVSGTVEFSPKADGVYPLVIEAEEQVYRVTGSNSPLGLYAGRGLSTFGPVGPLFFKVPKDGGFMVRVRGSGRETARITLYGPGGSEVDRAETNLRKRRAEIVVDPGSRAGGVWSISLTPAGEGHLGRCSVTIRPDASPVLSLLEGEVFDLVA